MGNSLSAREKARSDAIDRQIQEDLRASRRECNVLMLGSDSSEKSAILQQMKINHQGGFTEEEILEFKHSIHRIILKSVQTIILAMSAINLELADPTNRANLDRILGFRVDATKPFVFSHKIAKVIHHLWQDPIITRILEQREEISSHLSDNANYFLAEVLRVGSPSYRPTETDILKVREETTSIVETRFAMGQMLIRVLELGGPLPKRLKCIHCFEGVTSIIFCAALDEYDQVDHLNENKLAQSIAWFESIVNSRYFLCSSIILLLTKIDVFKEKLPKVPLGEYFPEYTGGADVNKAAKYILWRFMQANRARLSVYPHLATATDITNIRLVFAAIKETILQNALKTIRRDAGVL
ncbi:hypothetical protein HYDPIDRAFT_110344 [Hydnomerulius pinastri MD-312]|nr:hypothetical protein HYDPIDRAFT_110344 [Hydnomerulius pinastri MD-312]